MGSAPERILSGRPPSICWEGVALGQRHQTPERDRQRDESRERGDSGVNSLEDWDYGVELDCLSGPEGS